MPQSITAQLLDAVRLLENRVGVLEGRMDAYERSIRDFTDRLNAIENNIKMGRLILGFISALVSPLITSMIILYIQHVFK